MDLAQIADGETASGNVEDTVLYWRLAQAKEVRQGFLDSSWKEGYLVGQYEVDNGV